MLREEPSNVEVMCCLINWPKIRPNVLQEAGFLVLVAGLMYWGSIALGVRIPLIVMVLLSADRMVKVLFERRVSWTKVRPFFGVLVLLFSHVKARGSVGLLGVAHVRPVGILL